MPTNKNNFPVIGTRGSGPGPGSYTSTKALTGAMLVPIELVKTNKYNVRTAIDSEGMVELTQSVKENGILQPIITREITPGEYEIVAGERRFKAAQRAGLTMVPVIVKKMTDDDARLVNLLENVQRENLSKSDETRFFRSLMDQYNYGIGDLAKLINKSRNYVTARLDQAPDQVVNQTPVLDQTNTDSEKNHAINQKVNSVKNVTNYKPGKFIKVNRYFDDALEFLDQDPELDETDRNILTAGIKNAKEKISELEKKLGLDKSLD